MIALGIRVPIEIIVASHTRMSTTMLDTIVRQWIGNARHPRFHRPYTDLAYQPQLELLRYLRENGFRTFVVCAGTVEFMRPRAVETYGIRPDQVIGTSVETTEIDLSWRSKPSRENSTRSAIHHRLTGFVTDKSARERGSEHQGGGCENRHGCFRGGRGASRCGGLAVVGPRLPV